MNSHQSSGISCESEKKFYLLPIVLCMVFLGSLIVLTEGSAVAPFIYTMF